MKQALWLQPNQRQVIDWPTQMPGTEGVLWLNLQGPTPAELEEVAKVYDLHPAVVRACLHPEHRAKLKEFPGHLFLVLGALGRGTSDAKQADSIPELRRWRTLELDLIITERVLITVHPEPVPAVAALWQRLAKAGEGRPAVDYLVYALAEAVTSGYFVLLDRIDQHIDGMETQIFAGETSQALVDRLFTLKRHILNLRRTLAPQRDALSALMRREFGIFGPESRSYFVDLYEHNLRLFDLLDTYRDLISSSLDAYLSAVSNKMNDVMKTLTIVSVVMLPLSVMSGIFGMNFVRMPLIEDPHGFWV
ncbi:MAG TPA: magnesium transporter CorA family protein, partial [Symbiobacteriaceae bacterium]|nr:magnesium transporter CorA family protein [Symbiobacteriaceae bacterium]